MAFKFNPFTGNFDVDNLGTGGAASSSADGFNRVSAGTQIAGTNTTVVFSNSNNVSFGMTNSSIVTASASFNQTVQSMGIYGSSQTTGSASSGTHDARSMSFIGAGGISIGNHSTSAGGTTTGILISAPATSSLSATGVLSISTNASTISIGVAAPAASASNGSFSFNTVAFSNANNVTFGTSAGSIVTASVATNYQSQGAYLTTARASNDAVGLNTAKTNATWTVNSSGISLDAGGYAGTTSGSQSTVGSDIVFTHNTAGLNLGVPKYLTTAQPVGAYLTTARASNDAIGLNTAKTNVTWTVNSSGLSLDASGYAGTQTGATNANITVNSNGVSVSVNAGGAGDGVNILAAGTQTANTTGSVKFVDSNGISFGMSNSSQITASYSVPSTAGLISAINVSGGTTSNNLSKLTFSDSNGISFGLNGSVLTGTVKTDYQSSNANYLTSQSNQALSGSNGSYTFQTATFGNLNGMSFYTSNGSLVGSYTVPTQSVQPVNASASNGSFNFSTIGFSNANNVTFGTSAGSIITASVAAPGAAAENNWVNLLGANTAGNTTASGSTLGLSGINLTLSGTNNSAINISAPATSSLSATGLVSISTNGSTISIGMSNAPDYFYEPYPMMNPLTTTYAPGIGTWHFEALKMPVNLGSGRANMLVSMGSTSAMLTASNGANFASNTTGGASWSFRFDRTMALYTRGAGTNSTRLESFWSNTLTNGVSQSVGVSVTNASQLTVARSVSLQYVSKVETNGLYTTAGLGATHNASYASSVTATNVHTSAISSIYNILSGAQLVPFGLNTTLSAGDYWLGLAYSTASTTAGTSVNGASIWPQINQVGLYGVSSMSHRLFGATASSTGSQFMPGHGAIFSAVSASPPTTIAFTDLRSVASHIIPYFNYMQSVAS